MDSFTGTLRSYHSKKLNFNDLANFIEQDKIKIKFSKFKLSGASGMTLFDEIYINTNIDYKEKLFITILHEIAHCKIALRLGYEGHLNFHNSIMETMDFSGVMDEEVKADRYAEYCFYLLNGYECKFYNQHLNVDYKRKDYSRAMNMIYHNIPKELEAMNNYAKTMILC